MGVLAMVSLNGAVDLYAALRASGARAEDLPEVIAGCDAATRARLLSVDQGLLRAILRHASGEVGPVQQIVEHLRRVEPALMFKPDPATARTVALLTEGQMPDMPAFSDRAFDAWFMAQGVDYGLGLYGEKRSVYQTAQFADAASPERRTFHTGIDVFAPAGTPVYAPLAGKVLHVTYNADPLDYGHTLIIQHDAGGVPFYTLYGHLAGTLPGLVAVGDTIEPGQLIAHLGDWHENGGWAAHIHFQIMSDMLEQSQGNFFGVGHESLWDVWSGICPDPNLILRIPAEKFTI
jgi:murein DD-endopeptidase MepM/ murein hydrolase activator NlpD